MKQTFFVRTQHPATGNEFIVPIREEADTHLEAAEQRFNKLSPGEQGRVSALLVQRFIEGAAADPPQLFLVKRAWEVVPA